MAREVTDLLLNTCTAATKNFSPRTLDDLHNLSTLLRFGKIQRHVKPKATNAEAYMM